jgi:hypothetical protein
MTRPAIEVADIVRRKGSSFSSASRLFSAINS